MEQTAVEWLMDEYINGLTINLQIMKKAKEMEKEQIKNAWLNSLTKGDFNSAEEYYNQTFKNSEQ